MHLALLTERRYERPIPVDGSHTPYVRNVLEEDRLLAGALARRGVTTERVDWSRPGVDWASFDAGVFRTTWDYFERLPAFLGWLDVVGPSLPLLNPLPQIRWNLDKRYLLDLEALGVPIVPTVVLPPGAQVDLETLCADRGWAEIVVKPAVSGAAWQTWRGSPGALAPRLADLADRATLVQPFLTDVVARGEVSVIVIDGEPTHAVLKRARPGDFRVQDDHGGTVHPHTPSKAERALAEQVVAAVHPRPVYARVDLVREERGALALMELELVEPELFLRNHPPAAERLADGIVGALTG